MKRRTIIEIISKKNGTSNVSSYVFRSVYIFLRQQKKLGDSILCQNNLSTLERQVIEIKFTKTEKNKKQNKNVSCHEDRQLVERVCI